MRHPLQRARPVEILLVNDNAADARFLKEVLTTIAIPTTLYVVHDGLAALMFLRKYGAYAQASTPDLVLLDLSLPVLSGREVFVAMQRDVTLVQIPVCLLVRDPHDPSIAGIEDQGLQVHYSLTKPVQAEQLTSILIGIRPSRSGLRGPRDTRAEG